jgi:hypothetical protein
LEQHGVKEADIELAAATAKPSNVLLGIVFALSLLSFAFTLGGTSTTMWMASTSPKGGRIGLAENCRSGTTSIILGMTDDGEAETFPLLCSEDKEDDSTKFGACDKLKVKGPARYDICRRYGIKPENKVTLKVPGQIDKEGYYLKTADNPKNKYDYYTEQENDGDEKGATIVILGFCLAISVISNLLHFILVVTCAVVAIVGFLHNCLPTGKLPPVLPIITAGVGVAVSAVCVLTQLALFVFFMGGPGTTYGHNYDIGFYVAWMVVAIDTVIIALYVLRLELRIRGCCAGRDHCCASCC